MVGRNPASGGSPVVGLPSEFEHLAQRYRDVERSVQAVAGTFQQLKGPDHFAGEAAEEYRRKVVLVRDRVADVAVVADQVARIFESHAFKLEDLRSAAKSAVARAHTNWNDARTADQRLDVAIGELDWAQSQIEYMHSTGASSTDPSLYNYWSTRRQDADWEHRSAVGGLESAERALGQSETQLDALGADEHELNDFTAGCLEQVDLWSMSDPGFLEKIGSVALDAITWMDELSEHILFALEVLYEVLDVILLAIGVFIAAVIVLALVVGTGGTIIPLLLGALPVLLQVSAFFALLKVATGATLASHGRVGWGEVAVDIAFLALSRVPFQRIVVSAAKAGRIAPSAFPKMLEWATRLDAANELVDPAKDLWKFGGGLVRNWSEPSPNGTSATSAEPVGDTDRNDGSWREGTPCWLGPSLTPPAPNWTLTPNSDPAHCFVLPYSSPTGPVSNQRDVLVPFRGEDSTL